MADNIGNFNSTAVNTAAVKADATGAGPGSNGVHAVARSNVDSAVYGEHTDGGIGVFGRGGPTKGEGVFGQSGSASSGVLGKSTAAGAGVTGHSHLGDGVVGWAADAGAGVRAESAKGTGLVAEGPIAAVETRNSTVGNAAFLSSPAYAADLRGEVIVHGSVSVTGDLVLTNADLAEDFTTVAFANASPGTVMVIDAAGALVESCRAYDASVVGVVATGGDFAPAIRLDRQPGAARTAISLVGKTYCKVDARHAQIAAGDLLTTSDLAGHAMRASDRQRAFGAVLGKALAPQAGGIGLIPILITLQ